MKKTNHFLLRLVSTMVVVWLTAKLAPGFRVEKGLGQLLIASLVISLVQYVLVRAFSLKDSRAGQGGVGFFTTALVLYLAGKLTTSIDISLLGSLIGGLLIGLVDSIIPGERL